MPITHPLESVLPVLDKLGADVPSDLDVNQTIEKWFEVFKNFCESGDVKNLMNVIVEGAYWRDILALTWSFRTFEGTPKIKQFLEDRLALAEVKNFKLKNPSYAELQRPYPDLAWIQALFEFETNVGLCSGVVRLVPHADGTWKAHTILTTLDDLKGFPEKIGHLRESETFRGNWSAALTQKRSYADRNPTVLIIGGGHCGLEVAARLKYLGIDALVIEKNERIGDNWRKRYDALSLHDTVCKYMVHDIPIMCSAYFR
jgi:phosphoglycerate dehydrogenase-like enzyme